jgi:hypothetical protein
MGEVEVDKSRDELGPLKFCRLLSYAMIITGLATPGTLKVWW